MSIRHWIYVYVIPLHCSGVLRPYCGCAFPKGSSTSILTLVSLIYVGLEHEGRRHTLIAPTCSCSTLTIQIANFLTFNDTIDMLLVSENDICGYQRKLD